MKPKLTLYLLRQEARTFSQMESDHREATIYGITDGKAIGTYFEHKFQAYLRERYTHTSGSSARGVDFPGLQVDMKVTRVTQPQSSCPYRSARLLGYLTISNALQWRLQYRRVIEQAGQVDGIVRVW